MEFVKVESWKDAEAGFGDGVYGPETLGIKFPLSEKNKAAGETKSEYHYENVSSRMHQAMMGAENAESYFRHNIKPFPEKYPFVKVEAESVVTRSDGKVIQGEIDTEPDTPLPGSAQALIYTLKPEFIFVPGNVDSILVKLRDEVMAMAKGLEPSTPAKQKRIREIKGLVVSRRTFIEKVRVGYVADLVLKKSVTDTVSKNIQARLSGIEDEILQVTGYAAWEQGAKDRKAKNEKIVFDINAMQPHVYPTIDSLILAIAQLNAIDTESMEELSELATGAKKHRLEMLTADLVKRQDTERDAAELAELRRRQAEREEADRKAEQQRQEDERIDAAAEKLAEAKIQQAVEAAKVETRQEVIAELAAPVAEEPFEEVRSFVYLGNPAPVDDMPVTTVRALPVTGMIETREQAFNREAVAGLMGHVNLDRQTAIRVLTAIKAGNVPHIQIVY